MAKVNVLLERMTALEGARSVLEAGLKKAEEEIARQKKKVTELNEVAGNACQVEEMKKATEEEVKRVRKELEMAAGELWELRKAVGDARKDTMDEFKGSEAFSDLVHELSAKAFVLGIRRGAAQVKKVYPEILLQKVPRVLEEEAEEEEEEEGGEDKVGRVVVEGFDTEAQGKAIIEDSHNARGQVELEDAEEWLSNRHAQGAKVDALVEEFDSIAGLAPRTQKD